MKGPTALLLAALGVLVAMFAAMVGSAAVSLAALVGVVIVVLLSGFSPDADDGRRAGDGHDETGGEPAAAEDHDTCLGCGSVVPVDAEYCEDCAVVGSWRK